MKPLADFYGAPKHLCKQCCRERNRQWRRQNPAKDRARHERWRKSPGGRKATYRNHKAWRERNKWCDHERAQREAANLTDFYVKTLLKRRGVKEPTAEQIATKRRYIQLLRAKRALTLLINGARIKN